MKMKMKTMMMMMMLIIIPRLLNEKPDDRLSSHKTGEDDDDKRERSIDRRWHHRKRRRRKRRRTSSFFYSLLKGRYSMERVLWPLLWWGVKVQTKDRQTDRPLLFFCTRTCVWAFSGGLQRLLLPRFGYDGL